VLYALHEKVGDRVWRALEKDWAARYAGKSVTTDEWIAFVSRYTHRNLTGFLREWVYGTKTPPMPGHPDWETEPGATAARASSAARHLEAFGR
jgi:aminopeptidase N